MKKLTITGILLLVIQLTYLSKAQTWTYHNTSYGHIRLGPCNGSGFLHINGDVDGIDPENYKFIIYGKALTHRYGLFGAYNTEDLKFNTNVTTSSLGTTRMILKTNGNVGLGTTSPNKNLEIYEESSDYATLRINNYDGYMGDDWYSWDVSSSNSGALLFSYGHSNSTSNPSTALKCYFSSNGSIYGSKFFDRDGTNYYLDPANSDVSLKVAGKVGIGITSIPAGYDLAIDGKIIATEVTVQSDIFADYVFKDDYKLRTLYDVEQYIKENKHLPDVPSEAEVKENGVSLGEMNRILLQKIEEQTLYIIELNKRISELE